MRIVVCYVDEYYGLPLLPLLGSDSIQFSKEQISWLLAINFLSSSLKILMASRRLAVK